MVESLLANLSMGAILLAASLILKVFPPKKINMLYGYRTRRSMKNQETWNTGNQIAAAALLIFSVIQLAFGLGSFLILPEADAIDWTVGFMILGLIVMIIMIELRLKKLFDKDGNRVLKLA